MRESRFTHQPIGEDPSGNAHFALVCFQFRPARFAIFANQLPWRVRPAKLAWVGLVPQRLDLLEFLLALFELIARLKLQRKILSEQMDFEYNGAARLGARNTPLYPRVRRPRGTGLGFE